jgi:hypothetical protein
MGKIAGGNSMNIFGKVIDNIKLCVEKIRKIKIYNNDYSYSEIDIDEGEKLKLRILYHIHTGKHLY